MVQKYYFGLVCFFSKNTSLKKRKDKSSKTSLMDINTYNVNLILYVFNSFLAYF